LALSQIMERGMQFRKIASLKITTIICLVILFSNGKAKDTLPIDSVRIKFTTDSRAINIPFEGYQNDIFVNVRINGLTRCFLLDSGFGCSVLNFDRIKELGFVAGNRYKQNTRWGDLVASNVYDINIEFPGLVITKNTMEAIPLSNLETVVGRRIDGVLGFDIFRMLTIGIDYDQETLSLIQPDNFKYAGSGEIVPIEIINNRAYMPAEISMVGQDSIIARFGIDTGADCAVYFNSSIIQGISLVISDQFRTLIGTVVVGGESAIYITRLKGLKIGQTMLENLIIGYSADTIQGDYTGNIGAEILRRFKVIFDNAGKRLILEKGRHFDDPFDIDMSGIVPVTDSTSIKGIMISAVSKNSPAFHAGLKAGDKILSIDQKPISEIEIAKLREMLKSDGAAYLLTIMRDGETFNVIIKLRRWI
jgi:hypothetical protein